MADGIQPTKLYSVYNHTKEEILHGNIFQTLEIRIYNSVPGCFTSRPEKKQQRNFTFYKIKFIPKGNAGLRQPAVQLGLETPVGLGTHPTFILQTRLCRPILLCVYILKYIFEDKLALSGPVFRCLIKLMFLFKKKKNQNNLGPTRICVCVAPLTLTYGITWTKGNAGFGNLTGGRTVLYCSCEGKSR